MSKRDLRGTKLTDLVGTPMREIKEEFISVAEMQNRIMPDPHRLTVFGGFDIFGMTLPTSIVGGDFFDFIDVEERFQMEGKMGLVIADASGHGLSAAMLIRDFNTALYTAISLQSYYIHDTTPLLFQKINRRMFRSSLPNQFISAFYGELHHSGRLRYVNCGHLDPLLIRAHGETEFLKTGGTVLGAFLDAPGGYSVGDAELLAGDLLLCYTDGITETANRRGEEYGVDRLIRVVRKHARQSCRQIFDTIIEDVERFSSDDRQIDDRTVVLVKR